MFDKCNASNVKNAGKFYFPPICPKSKELLGISEKNGLKFKLTGKSQVYDKWDGCFKAIKQLVQFLYACKIPSPKDKKNKNGP